MIHPTPLTKTYRCDTCNTWLLPGATSWVVRVHRIIEDHRREATLFSEELEHYCEDCAPKDRWDLPEDCTAAHSQNIGQSRDASGGAVARFEPVAGRCLLEQWNEWMEDHNVEVLNEHDRFLPYTDVTRELFPADARPDLDSLIAKCPRVEIQFPFLGGTRVDVRLYENADTDFSFGISGNGIAKAAKEMVRMVCDEQDMSDPK